MGQEQSSRLVRTLNRPKLYLRLVFAGMVAFSFAMAITAWSDRQRLFQGFAGGTILLALIFVIYGNLVAGPYPPA